MTPTLKCFQHIEMAVDSEDWIPSWLGPLQRVVQVALSVKSYAAHRDLLERLLDQTQSAMSNGTQNCEAFHILLREIVYHMTLFPGWSFLTITHVSSCLRHHV